MCQKLPYCAIKKDPCIKGIVEIINIHENLATLSCCCGHERYTRTIVVENKRTKRVFEWFSNKTLERKKRNRYYKTDKNNFYYIPEVSKLKFSN